MVLRRQDRRGLTTLLFTDIVGSSEVAVELGDRRWHHLQASHHAEVRKQLKRNGGREVDTAGDGFFITFPSPARGVRCAIAIVQEVRELGLDVRAGLHIGEVELTGEKVGGIAVTTAARVSALAGPGQVLVTPTIAQMVAGSGLEFTELGSRELKGVPGRWDLFRLDAVDGEPIGAPLNPEEARQARDRSSPPEVQNRTRPWMVPLGIAAILLASAAALVLTRDDPGSTAAPTSPSPAPQLLMALREQSGAQAFPIDLPFISRNYPALEHVGPILFTGQARTTTAFTWVPEAGMVGLQVPLINRGSGAVIDSENSDLFRTVKSGATLGTTCICVASALERIWTPITTAPLTPVAIPPGVMLRGIGLEDRSEKDIVVDKALLAGGVAAFVSGGGYLWVGDTFTDRVYRVDPTSSAVKIFPLRQSADLMTFADGSLWVLDKLGGRLARVDPRSRHSTPSFPISGDLHGMTVGGGFVWVADASEDEIWQIPEDFGSPATGIHLGQIDKSPNSVAYDDGAIVVGFTDGTVAKIRPADPAAPAVLWTHEVGNDAESLAIDKGIVWVAGGPTNLR